MTRCVLTTKRKAQDLTGVERLLYGSLSAVECLLWLLYGAVWVDKHRVIIIEHRRPSCLHLTVTDLELRLHNTVSNPHSRIVSSCNTILLTKTSYELGWKVKVMIKYIYIPGNIYFEVYIYMKKNVFFVPWHV